MALMLSLSLVCLVLPSALATNTMLGKGYDLTTSDLWTYKNLVPLAIFSNFDPKVDIQDDECPLGYETVSEVYADTNSWYQSFNKDVGLNISSNWNGLAVSVGSSKGQGDTYSWWTVQNSSYIKTSNVRRCQVINSTSFNPYKSLSTDFIRSLKSLPLTPDDKDTMEIWKSAFITRYGTHWARESTHGAEIKTLASVDVSCHNSSDCLTKEICMDMSYANIFDLEWCKKQDQCSMSSSCQSIMGMECITTGGDTTSTKFTQLCSNTATEEQLTTFLNSGDLSSSSSIINMQFQSLADLVSGAGFYDQYKQLSQAILYAGCTAPLAWKPDNEKATSHSCQCNLVCQNNGVLNPDTCTCDCAGDDAHGYTDADCSKTYGKCQCAPGSQPNGADQCCVKGNTCGSAHESPECGNTEVCCNKDQYAKCCPFGSSCNPSGTSVECVDNNPARAIYGM